MAKHKMDSEGVIESGKFNQVIIKETKRPNGTVRYQQDYSNCPTLAEQHTAHLTNVNYLIQKYKPDELAAYMAARNAHRSEILGHDFATEPSMQDAKNMVYNSKQIFEKLPEEIQSQFKNPLEFFKFVDNPVNQEKLIKFGLLERKQIESITKPTETTEKATTSTPTT